MPSGSGPLEYPSSIPALSNVGTRVRSMITRDDLETLTSHQLHERAVGLGKSGGDIDWLWHLLGSIPAHRGPAR